MYNIDDILVVAEGIIRSLHEQDVNAGEVARIGYEDGDFYVALNNGDTFSIGDDRLR